MKFYNAREKVDSKKISILHKMKKQYHRFIEISIQFKN